MLNTRFELYKLHRELKRNGRTYRFIRYGVNEFGERDPDDEKCMSVFDIRCLYHETNGYVSTTVNDNTTYRAVKQPMLLCDMKELRAHVPKVGDFTVVVNNLTGDGKAYLFSGVTDIGDLGLIADISLEVFDDGKSS